jgi:hypothetical protein
LGLHEPLEDFLERFKQLCVSQQANIKRRLVLLRAFIFRDEVRHNIEESSVYCLPYEEVKKACLRIFGKQLEYWVFEELETKMEGNSVKKYTRRIFEILGFQAPMALNINNLPCPWLFLLCKRVWSNLPIPV